MIKNDSFNYFDILIGEQLSSVTFVMDYLQLDFDGNRLTCNVWPVVNVANNSYKYQQTEYRNVSSPKSWPFEIREYSLT